MSEWQREAETAREPVLSPVDRVSELLFGLFMALTFVGAVSVAEAGTGRDPQDVRRRARAATSPGASSTRSCTWCARSRIAARSLTLVRSVRAAADAADRAPADREFACREVAAGLVSTPEIEAIRGRIVALESLPARPTLQRDDLLAAVGIFLIVVASTFPSCCPSR